MLPVDVNERKSEGLDTEGNRISPCSATGIHGADPTSCATLKDLEVGGSGWRCSDQAGQPSNLLPQQGLGAPLPAETAHTHSSPNDCSLYLSPDSCSTSSPLHAPQSPCQEQAVVLDSRSVKISRLNNTIKSLFPLGALKKGAGGRGAKDKCSESPRFKSPLEWKPQGQELLSVLFHPIYTVKSCTRPIRAQSMFMFLSSQEISDSHFEFCGCGSLRRVDQFVFPLGLRTLPLKSIPGPCLPLPGLGNRVGGGLECPREVGGWKGFEAEGKRSLPRDSTVISMSLSVPISKEGPLSATHSALHLKNLEALCLLPFSAEPLHPEPPAVPPEEELQHLRKELERVSAELQAHMENHQHVSLLNQAQKERLRRQEERLQEQQERLREQEERLQQLAEPQSGIEEVNNENKSALHLEQEVEELQEKLGQVNETGTSTQKEPEAAVPAPGTGGESSGLVDLLEEKADLRERVEKLEHRFTQYWRERCHQKIKHLITEPEGRATEATPGGGHHLAGPRRRDEGGAAGAAGVAVAACADRDKGHRKFLAAAQSPDNEPGPGAPPPEEFGAAHKHGDLCEVSLTDSAETGQGEAREGSPHDNPTAQPIVQDHREHPGLGSNRCVPFFCWAWLRRRRR
uniref:Golgin subfamily A conserved domain-containing protein n=1 Tax=Chlorocebus sabaeus TaxID=60711 RepID=A0A0D9RWF0_CHLSB